MKTMTEVREAAAALYSAEGDKEATQRRYSTAHYCRNTAERILAGRDDGNELVQQLKRQAGL